MTVWDLINSINSKEYVEDSEEFQKNYSQFQVNLFYSMHVDTIMIANEINKMTRLTNRMHYDFYYNLVRKQKRYGYQKKDSPSDVAYIAEIFKVGMTEAKEIDKLLNEEQKEYLKNMKGGVS